MTLSSQLDQASAQLHGLSLRAAQAEAHVQAAREKGMAQIQAQIDAARAFARQREDDAKQSRQSLEGHVSTEWTDLRQRWEQNVSTMRQRRADAKAHRDAEHAEQRAQRAEDNALAALEVAASAIDEAEDEVLEAALARVEADEARSRDPRAEQPV
jgi:hypothetical protein